MKIVVNAGHTVVVAVKPGRAPTMDTEQPVRPVTKAYGPTSLLEIPDDEAAFLIARDIARKYEEPPAPMVRGVGAS